MKKHTPSRNTRLLCAAVPVCLLLAACDPVDGPTSGIPQRYKAPKLDTRRTAVADPENVRWLTAWRNLREELPALQENLTKFQEFHANNSFDSFLTLDPETLDKDQLCTLFHFLQRGYFTVERQILIDLLNRRLERNGDPSLASPAPKAKLKEMFAAAMHRDEIRMLDIESAIEHYTKAGNADIQIPNSLTDIEHEELLTTVNGMLEKTRTEIKGMDATLASLKARVFPPSAGDPPAPDVTEAPAPAGAVTTLESPDTTSPVEVRPVAEIPAQTAPPDVPPDDAASAGVEEQPLESGDPDDPTEPADTIEPELP